MVLSACVYVLTAVPGITYGIYPQTRDIIYIATPVYTIRQTLTCKSLARYIITIYYAIRSCILGTLLREPVFLGTPGLYALLCIYIYISPYTGSY